MKCTVSQASTYLNTLKSLGSVGNIPMCHWADRNLAIVERAVRPVMKAFNDSDEARALNRMYAQVQQESSMLYNGELASIKKQKLSEEQEKKALEKAAKERDDFVQNTVDEDIEKAFEAKRLEFEKTEIEFEPYKIKMSRITDIDPDSLPESLARLAVPKDTPKKAAAALLQARYAWLMAELDCVIED